MGITDKIAEVVLIVLLVIAGRRDRRAAQVPGHLSGPTAC
jgi:hypothetical protein